MSVSHDHLELWLQGGNGFVGSWGGYSYTGAPGLVLVRGY